LTWMVFKWTSAQERCLQTRKKENPSRYCYHISLEAFLGSYM
jgi:hypothetical protein